MLRFRAPWRLLAYLGMLVGVCACLGVSLSVLVGSLGSVSTATASLKVEGGLKRKNVPLPEVIQPSSPKLERVLTAPRQIESSFATVGPPAGQGDALMAPAPESSGSILVVGPPSAR